MTGYDELRPHGPNPTTGQVPVSATAFVRDGRSHWRSGCRHFRPNSPSQVQRAAAHGREFGAPHTLVDGAVRVVGVNVAPSTNSMKNLDAPRLK